MPLPVEITTNKVQAVSDLCDSETIQEAIDNAMCAHIGQVIETLTELYDLSPEQCEDLENRLYWRLELLPGSNGRTNEELAAAFDSFLEHTKRPQHHRPTVADIIVTFVSPVGGGN